MKDFTSSPSPDRGAKGRRHVSTTRYVLDTAGRLVEHDAGWDAFARTNGAPGLAGRPGHADAHRAVNLFAILKGRRVHDFYRALHGQILDGCLQTYAFPCRFDAPAMRRFGRLTFERGIQDSVVVTAVVDQEVPRSPVTLLAAPAAIGPGPPLPVLPMCSFCKDVKVPRFGQVWTSVEEYLADSGSLEVRLSYGICPRCYEDLVRPIVPSMR